MFISLLISIYRPVCHCDFNLPSSMSLKFQFTVRVYHWDFNLPSDYIIEISIYRPVCDWDFNLPSRIHHPITIYRPRTGMVFQFTARGFNNVILSDHIQLLCKFQFTEVTRLCPGKLKLSDGKLKLPPGKLKLHSFLGCLGRKVHRRCEIQELKWAFLVLKTWLLGKKNSKNSSKIAVNWNSW